MFEQEYASREEKWFSYYVNELKEHGFLSHVIYQPRPFILSKEVTVEAVIAKKNTKTTKTITLCRSSQYTADWLLIWTDKARGVFFWESNGEYCNNFFPYRKSHHSNFIPFYAKDKVSVVDIKGGFVGRNNSSGVTFSHNQKWVMQVYDVFVQKIVVSLDEKGLFYRTFTPRTVVFTEVYKKDYVRNKKLIAKEGDSKLKYQPTLIEQWIKKT